MAAQWLPRSAGQVGWRWDHARRRVHGCHVKRPIQWVPNGCQDSGDILVRGGTAWDAESAFSLVSGMLWGPRIRGFLPFMTTI